MLAFFGFIKKSCVLFVLFRKNFVTLQNNSINMMKIYSKKDDELLEACYSGDIETVKKFILDNEDENIFTYSPGVNTADGWNETTLHYACKGGHVDIIKFLIQHGCNIDSIARFGRTPLQLACRYEKLDAVRVLLENGADVNGLRKENTPLNTACYFNNLDIVKVLIENGANIEAIDICEKHTPLTFASERGYMEIVKFLIENGANIEAVDCYRKTPLILACENNHVEIVKFLIENGAK